MKSYENMVMKKAIKESVGVYYYSMTAVSQIIELLHLDIYKKVHFVR